MARTMQMMTTMTIKVPIKQNFLLRVFVCGDEDGGSEDDDNE